MGDNCFHIAMYPWFAIGHITPFLHLSNKLAQRGHKISFFIPFKTRQKMEQFNLHPDLITFIPLTIPRVEGLPPGAETTADVPAPLTSLLMTAMDNTRPTIGASLQQLKPHFVLYDFAHWLPSVTRTLGIKAIEYRTISAAATGYLARITNTCQEKQISEADIMEPPPGFPPSSIKLHTYEARAILGAIVKKHREDTSFAERVEISRRDCDAIAFKTCREMEGPYCDYFGEHYNKPVLLSGPVVSEASISALEERWAKWLEGFKPSTVIFCAFGSQCVLKRNQLQELLLGFEATGLPFLAVLKPPLGTESIESAFPEGFKERIRGRGVVYEGWIQQQLILGHPSVGCFVTHCGFGSITEGLLSECQLVLLPSFADQFINARMMAGDLKVGVEVEKGEEDGLFSKEGVCNAIRSVMEVDSKIGIEVRKNHAKLRELLLSKGLENSYIDGFVQKLQGLLLT